MDATYKKFTLKKYKAISKPISIDVSKGTGVLPMVGINESGKTTIMHAIMAFDHRNDFLNDRHSHLNNVGNVYTDEQTAEISATLEVEALSVAKLAKHFHEQQLGRDFLAFVKVVARRDERIELEISRTIANKLDPFDANYEIRLGRRMPRRFLSSLEGGAQNDMAKEILESIPSILYFDDFGDKLTDELDLANGNDDDPTYRMFKRMFRRFLKDPKFNFKDLLEHQENYIEKKVETVSKGLSEFAISNWKRLRKSLTGEEDEMLALDVRYASGKLKIRVKEIVGNEDNFFYLGQRSRGFYWFLNFIFKTHFNSRVTATKGLVYLLDEPGSYLHSSAQKELCEILKELGKENLVLYNTHSQYLLDEDFLPNIRIPYKDADNGGNIALVHHSQYGNRKEQWGALQPIQDALRIEPSLLDENYGKKNLVLVEGITDFYSFQMFLNNLEDIGFVPGKGAATLVKHVRLLLAFGKKILCVVDGDDEGTRAKEKIEKEFSMVAKVVQLDKETGATEGLYDLEELKALGKVDNADFGTIKNKKEVKGCVATLYRERQGFVPKLPKTKARFAAFHKERLEKALVELK